MARKMRKSNPGDAANAFVRVLLSDAGKLLGGFDEDEWHRTLDYFGNKCAYTGAPLRDGEVDRDHGIPMNRTHCGIHLFGNVLPTTRAANKAKSNRHYRDFVDDPELLAKVELFVEGSGYAERVAVLGDLRRYCEAQYRAIVALCGVNESYLAGLLPGSDATSDNEAGASDIKAVAPRVKPRARDDYCHWLCYVASVRADGQTVGLPFAEIACRVREKHPHASKEAARSYASYINTRKPGFEGFQLPDIRPR